MAGAAEHVELPIRIHDLFLGMAGRVDDDALSAAREMLAVGELTGAMEMLLGCLVAGRVVTSPREQEHLRDLLSAVNSDPVLAASLKVRDSWLAQQHRFSTDDAPDRGVAAAIRPVLDTLPGIESISCVWRTTPAGAAPCALPQRVVLLELGPEGLPTATSYRVHHALAAAGLPAVVEVLRPGTGRSDYHSRALAEAHGLDRNGGSDRGGSPERNAAPAGRGDYPGQQVPARSGSTHGRRSGNHLIPGPNAADEQAPQTGGFERSFGEERPLGRPKPVAKRASVTRIQSRPAEAPRPAESAQPPAPSSARPESDSPPPAPQASSDDGNGSSGLAGKAEPASAEPSVESEFSSSPGGTAVAPESAASTATASAAVPAPTSGGRPGNSQPGYAPVRAADTTAGHSGSRSGNSAHRESAAPSGSTGHNGSSGLNGSTGRTEYRAEYGSHTPSHTPSHTSSHTADHDADRGHPSRGERSPASGNGTSETPVLRSVRSQPGPGSTPSSGFAMTDTPRSSGFGTSFTGSGPAAASAAEESVAESSAAPLPGTAPAAAMPTGSAMPAGQAGPTPVPDADKAESTPPAAAEPAPTSAADATPAGHEAGGHEAAGHEPVGHEPASAHFASTELAGIGPIPTEPGPAAPVAGPDADPATSSPAPVPEQLATRRIPDISASVAKNLNDKERDLLRQLHEELAQREQRERTDSKRWQLARPQPNRESAPPTSGGTTAWPPLATEETLVNGTPPGGWPGPQS